MITKEILKKSIEARWRRHQKNLFWTIGIALIFFLMLFALPEILINKDKEAFGIMMLGFTPIILIFTGFIIYYQAVYTNLIKEVEDYEICEAVLDHPSSSYMYKHSLYYTLTFNRKNNERINLDTPPMFGNGLMGPNAIEDYNNERIYVAYSKSKDKMVVLGKEIEGEN